MSHVLSPPARAGLRRTAFRIGRSMLVRRVHLLLAPALLAATLFLLWAGGGAASLDGRRAARRTGVQPDGRVGR